MFELRSTIALEPCIAVPVFATAMWAYILLTWPWISPTIDQIRKRMTSQTKRDQLAQNQRLGRLGIHLLLVVGLLAVAHRAWLSDVRGIEETPQLSTLMTAARFDDRWTSALQEKMQLVRPRYRSRDFARQRRAYRLANGPDRNTVSPGVSQISFQADVKDIFPSPGLIYGDPILVDECLDHAPIQEHPAEIEKRFDEWRGVFGRWELLFIPKHFWPQSEGEGDVPSTHP